ncbi:MAG: CHAT domain-containing protein [Phycisphaera sp.]|nr:MAG: CHAT domain-containing protein [Phycisphaera sp.]
MLLQQSEQLKLLLGSVSPGELFECWIDECRAATLQDPEQGLTMATRLIELMPEIGNPRLMARARSAMCHALSYSGKMKPAIAMSEHAIATAESAGDDHAIAEACLTSVQSHNVLGLRAAALRLALRAGEIFDGLGDNNRSATAIMLAGVVLRMLDRPSEALERFDAAIAVPGINESLAAQLASNRAEAFLDIGHFELAKESFEQALRGFESCNQTFGSAIVEGNLADLASRRGRLPEALSLFLSASKRFRESNDAPESARLEAEAAELFLAIGDAREALKRLPKAIDTLTEAGMHSELLRARMAYGIALGRNGDLGAAFTELGTARDGCLDHGLQNSAARAEALRGGLLLSFGIYEDATGALEHALSLAIQKPARARILLDLSRSFLAGGRTEEAKRVLEEASILIKELGLGNLDAELSATRAGVYRQTGNAEQAREAIANAFTAIESTRGLFSGDRLRAACVGGRSSVYNEAMKLAIDTKDAMLALETSERRSARSLVESIGSSRRAASEDLDLLESDVIATLGVIESAQDNGKDEASINSMRKRLRDLQSAIASKEAVSEQDSANRIEFRFSGDDLLSAVPSGCATISIEIVEQELVCIVVNEGQVELSPCSVSYEAAVSRCRSLMTDIDRAQVRLAIGRDVPAGLNERIEASLGFLGDGILGSVQTIIEQCSRVVLVLPRELSNLPVSAIRVGGEAFVEKCTPVLAPSLTWASRSAAAHNDVREGMLVAGVPDERAPHIADEVEAITQSSQCQSLLGNDVTLDALGGASSNAKVVHLACHAEYAPEDPMGSRLLLGDGWCSARRVSELPLQGASVVLSGCETGYVDGDYSGENFGLIRAVLLAGAHSVIASTWRLSDAYARDVFTTLHSEHTNALDDLPDRLAKLLVESSANGAHPALWGGLFAIGSWT